MLTGLFFIKRGEMKFCYLDESGIGDEPYAVMVGIIVDAQRMHVLNLIGTIFYSFYRISWKGM